MKKTQKKKITLALFITISLVVGLFSGISATPVQACDSAPSFLDNSINPENYSLHKRLNYEDSIGLKFTYSDEFQLIERFAQEYPYREPHKIIKRISLVKDQMFLDIDFWESNNREFGSWLEDLKEIYKFSIEENSMNTIDGRLYSYAISSSTEFYPSLQISLSFGDNFVQLNHKFTNNLNDLDRFLEFLKSVTVEGLPLYEIVGTELFEKINEYNVLNQKLIDDNKVIISADQCCGLSSPGNPFQCCSTNSSLGNCTWHVYRQYGSVPFRGDANSWYYQVYITPGWESSNTPPNTSKSIGWHERGSMGHVAYVTSRNSSSVSGSEQNWCETGCPSYFYGRQTNFFQKYLYRLRDIITNSNVDIGR